MYQSGDYVIGYPNFFYDNGKKHTFFGGKILGAENRQLLHDNCALENLLQGTAMPCMLPEYVDGVEEMEFQDLQGLVVEVDTFGEDKPHEDGAVRVLLGSGEKILWFWARNVRPVRLATGGLK